MTVRWFWELQRKVKSLRTVMVVLLRAGSPRKQQNFPLQGTYFNEISQFSNFTCNEQRKNGIFSETEGNWRKTRSYSGLSNKMLKGVAYWTQEAECTAYRFSRSNFTVRVSCMLENKVPSTGVCAPAYVTLIGKANVRPRGIGIISMVSGYGKSKVNCKCLWFGGRLVSVPFGNWS